MNESALKIYPNARNPTTFIDCLRVVEALAVRDLVFDNLRIISIYIYDMVGTSITEKNVFNQNEIIEQMPILEQGFNVPFCKVTERNRKAVILDYNSLDGWVHILKIKE